MMADVVAVVGVAYHRSEVALSPFWSCESFLSKNDMR